MANTPLRLNNAQNALDDFLSPRSSTRKNVHKRTSTGVGLLVPTPCLPEATENELDTARQRRLSRNFVEILSAENEAAETPPCAKWSKDELLQHSSRCLKLAQENKINHKNAFDLQLIEHMGEMIQQDGALNFRVAGGTIFAGAQIYASRVDAIHSQIYRVLGSLNSGDKDDNPADDERTDDAEKRTKKRKKNSKILETNESNLRLQATTGYTTEELRARSRNTTIDAASCASLRLNHERLNKNEKGLQNDFDDFESQIGATENTENAPATLPFRSVLRNLPVAHTTAHGSCPSFTDFDFDTTNADLNYFATCASNDDEGANLPSTDTNDETVDNCCDPTLDSDPLHDDDDPVFDSQPDPVSNIKRMDITSAMDVAELVAVAPPAEYSYFVANVLSVCDGPGHWRKLRSHRTVSKLSTHHKQDEGTEVEKPQPKRRKTEEKRDLFKKGKTQPDKRIQPQKCSKARLESFRHNVQDNLLMENLDRVTEALTRAKELKVHLKQLTSEQLRNVGVDASEPASTVNFNYANDDFCPATANDDYDDHDNSDELFTDDHTTNFFPDFTQNMTSSIDTEQTPDDYNALLEGDHLLNHPRKAEKVQIHFAKRAKRIDVRRLKSAMWTLINDEKDPSGSEEDQPEENQTSAEPQDSSASPSSGPLLFSEMYSHLPGKVSKNMWENLSVPLAFNCLLHLANEKILKIEGNSSLSDLKITQDHFQNKP